MPSKLRLCAGLLACIVLWLAPIERVAADIIVVNSAELRLDDEQYDLNAEFGFALNRTLEEALHNGIPLYFDLEFDLSRPRPFWFDDTVAHLAITYRVSYDALTQKFRVATGLLSQQLDSLDEVERLIARVVARPVVRQDAVTKGVRYEAALRLRLDVAQLPKPFQINALASREWSLTSDWYRWTFVP